MISVSIFLKNLNPICNHDLRKIQNISKTFVFVFHHSTEHDEASGYTFCSK